MKTMTVVAVSEVKTDKNDRSYKTVALRNQTKVNVVDPETGEIFTAHVPAKTAKINAYEESYLDGTPSFLYDLEEGAKVLGKIVTREVEEYEIVNEKGARAVRSYSTPVFGNSDQPDWDLNITKAFRSAGHPLPGDVKVEELVESPSLLREDAIPAKKAAVPSIDNF